MQTNGKNEPRVGVYICHCGSNIAGTVDCAGVAEFASTLPGVVSAKHYAYMCSEPGQALIKEDIKKIGVNRVVVASCSPRMHEPTYRKVLEECGLSPFYFEMANIREHVSCAHMHEKEKATEKAKDLVKMAVARAKLLEAISRMEVKVTSSAVVLGGGIAGITATLDLLAQGFKVCLVEREPYLGGNASLLNKLYWGGDATSVFKNYYQKLENPNVTVLTNAEITEHVEGYIGNFNVKIDQKPICVNEKCNSCGKCSEVCPVSVPNAANFGLDQRKAIYKPFKISYPDKYYLDTQVCTKCGKCVEACPQKAINLNGLPSEFEVVTGTIIVTTGFEPYNPEGEYGFGESRDVITQLQLERLLNPEGPTQGRLVRPSNGMVPKSVTFIMCVGSRQTPTHKLSDKKPDNLYCSRYCCSSALKNAIIVKEQLPETEVYVLYRDIRTFGREQEKIYRRARELGANFLRFKPEDVPKVSVQDGVLRVVVNETLFNRRIGVNSDLVVLVEGMVPRHDVAELNATLSITRSPDGFFQEAHPKMNPLDTFSDGIFIGGTAQGPKDIIDTISQASGAAAKAAIPLSRGKVLIDLVTATVDENLCVGCSRCVDVCPYHALTSKPETGLVEVTEVKCKGCGSCAATCPVGAMQLRHCKDSQIYAMVESLMKE